MKSFTFLVFLVKDRVIVRKDGTLRKKKKLIKLCSSVSPKIDSCFYFTLSNSFV